MIGFLLRRLPFWVREPVLIAVGSVLGVRIAYLAVHDHDLAAAGLGAVFLVFTATRVHAVVRALRARRSPSPVASATGVAAGAVAPAQAHPQAHPQARAEPPLGPEAPEKEPNAWGQAVAAVALFGAIAAVLLVAPRILPTDDGTPRPATCSGGEAEELPAAYKEMPQAVTGDELCKALNRPGLAQLLGTPGETVTAASGSSNTVSLSDGTVAQPEAQVTFDTYTVNISATYNELSTARYASAMRRVGDGIRTLTVLGRPAVFSSDHTMEFEISIGSGGSAGPVKQGPLARKLSVALDRKDRGGHYAITVWSASGALPADSVLLGIAEEVIPAIPERAAR
jgi:uncharacterized protein DUF6215